MKPKYYLLALFTVFLPFLFSGCGDNAATTGVAPPVSADKGQILLASTIGPIDAGIVAALEDAFTEKTGISMRHVGAGTGEAIKIGQSGAVDLLLVHAKVLEEQFVADGYGTERIPLMYNDFVIVGPAEDPAQIKGLTNVNEALQKIAGSQVNFVSRGDNSGTHVKEKELWQAAGIEPVGAWYEIYEKGAQGNGPTLKYTNEKNAYTIMDRATYLTLKDELKIDVLVEKDESMLNHITLIPVNPDKFPTVRHDLVDQFVSFATGREGQMIIKEFGVDKYGAPLFFPESEEGKKL